MARTCRHAGADQARMQITLVYDRVIDDRIGYPNLARHQARPFTPAWRQFDQHWPWVVPLRLTMYFDQCGIDYQCHTSDSGNGWYPISFSWFDFEIDYFGLIPPGTQQRIKQGHIRVLFYYHEGDNPSRIQHRLEHLSQVHGFDKSCFVFISANTAADWYFSDHECFFRYVNRNQTTDYDGSTRTKDFTLLNRQHKWWRASVVADLARSGILDNSTWSYDTAAPAIDDPQDNPISIYTIDGLPQTVSTFLSRGPYKCDTLSRDQQNDHHWVNVDLYKQSHFHIVIETHYDADQSDGTFLTEKTWKCIKYGQPFVIVGPAGTLQHLREQGFRVFDQVLDNSYDLVQDPTQRWLATKKLIQWIKQQDIQRLWQSCQDDVAWNQHFFDTHAYRVVNTLAERLQCHE